MRAMTPASWAASSSCEAAALAGGAVGVVFDDRELEDMTFGGLRVGPGHAEEVAQVEQERLGVGPFGGASRRPVRNEILNFPLRHGGVVQDYERGSNVELFGRRFLLERRKILSAG